MTDGSALIAQLRRCCLRVRGPRPGTGVLVAPGWLVTCAHVVRGLAVGAETPVSAWADAPGPWTTAELVAFHPTLDVALLRVLDANLAEVWAPLDHYLALREPLVGLGFPQRSGREEFDTFTAEYEGIVHFADAASGLTGQELKLKGGQVEPGYSGGPLLNLRSGRVVGITIATRDRQTALGGWGVPAQAVTEFMRAQSVVVAGSPDDWPWAEPAIDVLGPAYAERTLTAAAVRALLSEQPQTFIGRAEDLDALDSFVERNPRGVLAVTGVAGSGKSALLARWIAHRARAGDDVLRHVIARRAPETTSVVAGLAHLLRQLKVRRGESDPQLPETERTLGDAVFERLMVPAAPGRLLVVIDGLDEADSVFPGFPSSDLGIGVFIILGIRSEPGASPPTLAPWSRRSEDRVERRHLEALSVSDVAAWLSTVRPGLEGNRDTLVSDLMAASEGLPLYLKFVVEDLIGPDAPSGGDLSSATSLRFADYVEHELDLLNQLGDLTWSASMRSFFALLTRLHAPIGLEELVRGGLVPRDLNLMRMDHRVERWLSVRGRSAERQFAFAHPRLAAEFGRALGVEAMLADEALLDHVATWRAHRGPYAIAWGADHLLDAKVDGRSGMTAAPDAAAWLMDHELHQLRLAHPLTDDLMARAAQQLRRLAADGHPDGAVRTWASLLAEAQPLLSTETFPDRRRAQEVFTALMTDFATRLPSPGGARSLRSLSPLRAEPPPVDVVFDGHTDQVRGARALQHGRTVSWQWDSDPILVWDRSGRTVAKLQSHEGIQEVTELRDGRLVSFGNDGLLRLVSPDGVEIETLWGHTGRVNGVTELKDGRLASCGDDGQLAIWSADGKLEVVAETEWRLNEVRELPSGRVLSEGSSARALMLWSSDGNLLGPLFPNASRMPGWRSAIELPDGRLFAFGATKDLYLLDRGGKVLKRDGSHTGTMSGALLLPDARLLTHSWDGTLRLWTQELECLRVLEGHRGGVSGALLLPDRNILSWSRDRTLAIWSPEGDQLSVLTGHLADIGGAKVARGERIVSWDGRGAIRAWTISGEPAGVLEGHRDGVADVLTFEDGRLLSWSKDATLRVWTLPGAAQTPEDGSRSRLDDAILLSDGRALTWWDNGDLVLGADVPGGQVLSAPDGHTIGALERTGGTIISWSSESIRAWSPHGEPLWNQGWGLFHTDHVCELAEERLLFACSSGLIVLGADGERLATVERNSQGGAVPLPSGHVVVLNSERAWLWGGKGDTVREISQGPERPEGGRALADGGFVIWNAAGEIGLWDAAGVHRTTFGAHEGEMAGLAVLDGDLLVTAAKSGPVRAWDHRGALVDELDTGSGQVLGLRALDTRQVAAWQSDGVFRRWTPGATVPSRVPAHRGAIAGLAPWAGALLTWGRDGTVRLWGDDDIAREAYATPYGPIRGARFHSASPDRVALLLYQHCLILTRN